MNIQHVGNAIILDYFMGLRFQIYITDHTKFYMNMRFKLYKKLYNITILRNMMLLIYMLNFELMTKFDI